MGVTFFDIFRPADAYQDGWNDCAREASAMLADERRRHREVVAWMREKKRRKDLLRMARAEAAEPGLVEPDRLLWRARALCIIARAKGRRCSLYGATPLQPRMSDLVRRHQDDRRIYGPRGPLPG